MEAIIEEAYYKAIDALTKCINKNGLYASGGIPGYNSIWSRDTNIALLGASLLKDKKIKEALKKNLILLSEFQNDLGEIPNCLDLFDKKRPKQVTFATIDSSLWYIIGMHAYSKNYKDNSLLKKYKRNIKKAFLWVKYQDAGNEGLPEQQPTSDWQDAYPHKYGHVLNTQALYYAALNISGKKEEAHKIKEIINGKHYKDFFQSHHHKLYTSWRKDLNFFDKSLGYYLPWIWKDHNGDREHEEWFDSLANLLMIVFNATDKRRANKIIEYIKKQKINQPYPVHAIDPPIYPQDLEWHSYFGKAISKPYEYLNAGIWPFIGGFYIASLVKLKQFRLAEKELNKLAMANKQGKDFDWEFNEWLHGETGRALGGQYQAWSAGMYIFAYESVKNGKIPIFSSYL